VAIYSKQTERRRPDEEREHRRGVRLESVEPRMVLSELEFRRIVEIGELGANK